MSAEYAGRKNHSHSLGSRLMYGCAEFYNGGAFVIINSFFTVFLVKALGMPTALAGIVPLIGNIWDAITDPLMGIITDRTTSRFGAKRFYILIGAFATGVSFTLIWVPFHATSPASMLLFYALMYCLFSTGSTILMVPYNGLLPDMVDDYNTRAKFSNIRMIWSTLGSMVCGLVPTFIISDPVSEELYFKCALLFGLLFMCCALITFAGTWEKKHTPVKTSVRGTLASTPTVFRSISFRLFIGIYLFGQCGMDFVSGMAVYFVDDVLNGYRNHYLTYLMAMIVISQLLGMLIWGPVMVRTSKKTTILIGAPIRIVSTLGLLGFAHEGASIVPVLALTAGIGFGNAATLTSIFAIMADMPDVDELITSVHRPGAVSGMATFARKISSGLSAAIIGFMLSAVGYDEKLAGAGARQSLATQHGIALTYVFLPVILSALLFLCAWYFPMKAREFDVVKKEISRRRGEELSETTDEEKQICERVTGLPYEALWNPANAALSARAKT